MTCYIDTWLSWKEVDDVKMVRLLIQLPLPLKTKLDALRSRGYTAAGFIRHLLERELNQPQEKGRKDGER